MERGGKRSLVSAYVDYTDSHVKWLEKIPSRWRVVRLKYLASEPLAYGANEAALDDNPNFPRFIRITDINEDGSLRPETFKSLAPGLAKSYLLREADVLLARSGATVGKAFIYRKEWGEACFAAYLIRFRCNKERLLPDFFYIITQSSLYWSQIQKGTIQATIQNFSAEKYGDLLIPLPPLSEQRLIVQYLERQTAKIDVLITAKQRLLELLAEKRRVLVTNAVSRGVNPDAPLHYSGTDLLGDIPVHWDLLPLRRLLKLIDYGISESVDVQGKIAVLRMGDVGDGEISYKNVGFVEEVEPRLLLAMNDLVLNRTNSLDQVGKVGIFRGNESFPVSFASYLVRLRCNHLVIPEFLNYQLNSQPMRAWARSEALTAFGQANLNPNRYSYLPIPLPPVHEQLGIVKYLNKSVKKINQLCAATQQTIELLQERRVSVISAAVLGKIYLS